MKERTTMAENTKRKPRTGRRFSVQEHLTELAAGEIKAARTEAATTAAERVTEAGGMVQLDLWEYLGTVTATAPETPDPVVVWE